MRAKALLIRTYYDGSGLVITDPGDIGRVLAAIDRAVSVEPEKPSKLSRYGAEALVITQAAPNCFGLELIDWPTNAQLEPAAPAAAPLSSEPTAAPIPAAAPGKGDDDVPF